MRCNHFTRPSGRITTSFMPFTGEDGSSCLDEQTLLRWATRQLRPKPLQDVERHIEACVTCRELAAEAAKCVLRAEPALMSSNGGGTHASVVAMGRAIESSVHP